MSALSHAEIGEVLSLYLEHKALSLEMLAEDEGISVEELEQMIRHWEPSNDGPEEEEASEAMSAAVKAVLGGESFHNAARAYRVGDVLLRRELMKDEAWAAAHPPSTSRAAKGGGFRGEVEAWICSSPSPVTFLDVLDAFPPETPEGAEGRRRAVHNCLRALREQGRITMQKERVKTPALYSGTTGGTP